MAVCAKTHAAFTFNSGFENGGTIPNGNAAGWSDTRTISGLSGTISSISVNFQISGGYNGDLYGYLSHGGALIPLVNRVGVTSGNSFGYDGAGFNVTLSDLGAGGDIHFYGGGFASGPFEPDGRNIDPASSPGSFDTAPRLTFGSTFGGMDPNGSWTLYFSDMVSDEGSSSTLMSWGMDITAVPEPINIALGAFAFLFASIQGVRWWQRRTLSGGSA